MPRRPLQLLIVTVLVAAVGLTLPGFSSATFTDSSRSTATVRAAADWTPPTVTMTSPGAPVKDTVTLTATATDAETGIASVTMEYLTADGAAWVSICTDTTAPYTCAWNTKTVSDGPYELRARTRDDAGYAATSEPVRTTVANSLLVVLNDPGDVVRGNVALSTSVYNAGAVTYTVRVEYSPAGAGTWKNLCTNLSAPYTCTWGTAGYPSGDYDLRAVATSGGTSFISAVVPDVLVDNVAPSLSLGDLPSPLSGTATFAASAGDAHSGVAQVLIQYAPGTSTTFKTLCTLTSAPYTCRVDTTQLLDGSYGFRAVATDLAGNTTTTAVVSRTVDNTVSSISVEHPGSYLTGSVTLAATANSSAGVTSVRIQVAPTGSTSWSDVCTDTTAPYTCTWDTRQVPDGPYDVRGILVDGTTKQTVSPVVTGARVDNSPVRALDVQTVSGGATPGKLDQGDQIRFTYSEQVATGTLAAGWTGAPTAVTVRLRDGNLLGLGGKDDTLDVSNAAGPVRLGSVNLREQYLKANKAVTFNATMTATTVTVDGVARTIVTVQLGSLASGTGLRTATLPASMVWSPSAAVTDIVGVVASTAPATESGALDRDF